MATTAPTLPSRTSPALPHRTRTARISVRSLGPNWYATVMGTAIVASAGVVLPVDVPGTRAACAGVWVLSALLLVALLGARATHWARHGDQARAHLLDPAVAPFYGCAAMALLAVGGGTLAVGGEVIGTRAAVAVDAGLWLAGTAVALLAAAGVPYLMIARHRIGPGDASPVWLLPVVAPMVSAALGPALVPHLPTGQWREAMLLACYALFGLSLLGTLVLLPIIVAGLLRYGPPPLALTPTLFLVLGPLGQSTTAVGQLAIVAPGAIRAPYPDAMAAFAVLYGVPVMGFALLWLALAAALVVRAVRGGMPYAMTWWAFTFPVGTCVTGAAVLARHTDLAALRWLAVGLYALLVLAWAVASVRTVAGIARGTLLAPDHPAPARESAAAAEPVTEPVTQQVTQPVTEQAAAAGSARSVQGVA
ncbi:TDT family transporter [Streptomyces zagrosensis]|uniref:C4-dicarboxylate transporter/malic acid transport protein n=1 Tax=Streptomyces zagrosensis TaxID=1042984 RepID=A0A7W9V139_9ACTN|nr:TDT family transporter [Streptomyces zagrosensis]MBB5938868.1 C4-dicarboxylate transporter/malic acid transport protein [Streptomyces zagrosensis]